MKSQTKALVASLMVIALALSAVSGITYSWFSDTEQSKIDVTTAIVDFEPTYTTNSTSFIGTTLEKGTLNGGVQPFTIKDLAANYHGIIVSNIENKSTVKAVYRMYATYENTGSITDYDIQNISINGKYLSETTGTSASPVIITDWTELAVNDDPTPTGITINTPVTYGSKNSNGTWVLPNDIAGYSGEWNSKTARSGLTINIVIEAYQGDYPYTEMTVSSSTATATIPENGVVKTKANDMISTTNGNVKDIVMDFSNAGTYTTSDDGSTKKNITGTQISATVTGISTVESTTNVSLDLQLKSVGSDGTTTTIESPKFTNPVVITMTVPGQLLSPKVVYNGSGEDATVLSSTINSDSTTTIVFSVTHFSNYIISDTSIVKTAKELQTALNAGGYVKLGNDITVSSGGATGVALESNMAGTVLDLNGYEISTTDRCLIDVQDSLTICNGKLICTPTEKEGRVINIDGDSVQNGGSGAAKNMRLTLRNVDVIGPTDNSENRGISVWGTTGLTIDIDGGTITANHYPLNIVKNNTGIECNVKNATLEGYCAFQSYSAGTLNFEDCTLSGVNQWTTGADGFATMALHVEANASSVTVNNCIIKASTVGAKEFFLDVRCSSYDIKMEQCKYFMNGTEVSLSEIQEKESSDSLPVYLCNGETSPKGKLSGCSYDTSSNILTVKSSATA